jgi:chromosome segregation ATPase
MRKVVVNLKRKLSEFDNVRELSERIGRMESEYMWAVVHDEELRKGSIQKKLASLETDSESLVKKIEHLEEVKRNAMVDTNAKDEIRALRRTIGEREKRQADVRVERNGLMVRMNEYKSKLRNWMSDVKAKKTEVVTLEKTLAEIQAVSEQDESRITREYEEKKEELERRMAHAQQTLLTLQQDGEQFKNGADAARQQLNEFEDQNARLVREIGACVCVWLSLSGELFLIMIAFL